ncbi:GRB2-related adapter protein 2b [Brachyistius frenatus]|uniref:GRB2-related adapter protein 2b n=1 Tax=Brachyistius frenatus TaxID=100188 RepID=UPI0037E89C71
MEATAKYNFEATDGDELSFRRGDCLMILQTSGNWYKAELNKVVGFVPKNFVNIHLPSWYQETASRSDAEESLMSQPVGTFLIRSRQNAAAPTAFAMSVRHPAEVQHFKLLRNSRGQFYLWSQKFYSLNRLVEYYKKNSVSKQSQLFLQETQTQQRKSDNPPDRPAPLPTCPSPDHLPGPAPREGLGSTEWHEASSTLQVRALYSFQAEETDELEFNTGDIITVLEFSDEVWWKGQLRGKTGLFPSNYTKPLREKHM